MKCFNVDIKADVIRYTLSIKVMKIPRSLDYTVLKQFYNTNIYNHTHLTILY